MIVKLGTAESRGVTIVTCTRTVAGIIGDIGQLSVACTWATSGKNGLSTIIQLFDGRHDILHFFHLVSLFLGYFLLFQDLLATNDIHATLHLLHALTIEVVDGLIFICQFIDLHLNDAISLATSHTKHTGSIAC